MVRNTIQRLHVKRRRPATGEAHAGCIEERKRELRNTITNGS